MFENLVLNLLIITQLIFFFILITYLVNIVRRNSVLVTHGSYRVNIAHAVWHGLLVSAFTISCMLWYTLLVWRTLSSLLEVLLLSLLSFCYFFEEKISLWGNCSHWDLWVLSSLKISHKYHVVKGALWLHGNWN